MRLWSKLMIISLFIIYFVGIRTLKLLYIIRYRDALYLFFIGLHIEKILIMKNQIDELVYDYILITNDK